MSPSGTEASSSLATHACAGDVRPTGRLQQNQWLRLSSRYRQYCQLEPNQTPKRPLDGTCQSIRSFRKGAVQPNHQWLRMLLPFRLPTGTKMIGRSPKCLLQQTIDNILDIFGLPPQPRPPSGHGHSPREEEIHNQTRHRKGPLSKQPA
eukprot:6915521-Heterocapsa_arctica.AAC.1